MANSNRTAIDGLKISEYLLDTAKEHIEGNISTDEAQKHIQSYYERRTERTKIEDATKEADIVSARIAKLLGEKSFQFLPAEWMTIHRRLFEGMFKHAGQVRTYNNTKKEWVLNGDTVIYADFNSIRDTLDYDFATEKQFSYEGLSVEAAVRHLAKFASDIWQIHPFCEGNTRATAAFMIKYMKTFGFRVNNDAFQKNSWYFRNALVRTNYCQAEGYDRPDYETVEDIIYDDNSHKFTVRCYLNGYYVDGEGSKVKEAKKQAAFNMMKYMDLVD